MQTFLIQQSENITPFFVSINLLIQVNLNIDWINNGLMFQVQTAAGSVQTWVSLVTKIEIPTKIRSVPILPL